MSNLGFAEDRFAGTEGERAALHAIRQELPTAGWLTRVEGFVAHVHRDWIVLGHALGIALLVLLALVFPTWAAVLALIVGASLAAECLHSRWSLRTWLIKAPSYNLTSRNQVPEPSASVVITAALDATRGPRPSPLARSWHRRTVQWVVGSCAIGWVLILAHRLDVAFNLIPVEVLYGALGLIALTSMVRVLMLARRNSNASVDGGGVETVLELMRRFSENGVPGVEIWTSFTGCSDEVGAGMEAFIDLHQRSLADPALFIHVDHPDYRPLVAYTSCGSPFSVPMRATGPGLIERLRWAGLDILERSEPRPSNAYAATLAGHRALTIAGGNGPAPEGALDETCDIVEVLIRLFGQDAQVGAFKDQSLEAFLERLVGEEVV